MNLNVCDLPFNRLVGLERAAQADRLLALPRGPQYHNHLGTVHASALLALAEASSGEYLLRHFGSISGLVPVVRRLEAKFRRPAVGEVYSSVAMDYRDLSLVLEEITTRQRAKVSVGVELHDEAGNHVLSATVEWFVQRVGDSNTTAPAPGE